MTSVLLLTWAWLLMALVGCAYSLYLSREAWRDLRAVPPGETVARMVARANALRDLTRMTIQALMAIVGFISLANVHAAASRNLSATPTITRLAIRFIFIAMGALLMGSSVMDYRARAAVLDVIKKEGHE